MNISFPLRISPALFSVVYCILDVPRVNCVFQALGNHFLVLESVDYLLTYIFLPLNIRLHVTILTLTITLQVQDLTISTSI